MDESKVSHRVFIPTSIFLDRTLSVLEIMSEYLKEEKGMKFHEIAKALSRDDRTIWTCYHRAKKKRKKAKPSFAVAHEWIPSEVFSDRSLSVLEAITEYLKDQRNMGFSEIGKLLNRDNRTIWTCYSRVRKKRKK